MSLEPDQPTVEEVNVEEPKVEEVNVKLEIVAEDLENKNENINNMEYSPETVKAVRAELEENMKRLAILAKSWKLLKLVRTKFLNARSL